MLDLNKKLHIQVNQGLKLNLKLQNLLHQDLMLKLQNQVDQNLDLRISPEMMILKRLICLNDFTFFSIFHFYHK